MTAPTTIACPCGQASLSADARFCPACGSALARRCAACDTALERGQRFCHRCGAPAATDAVARAARAAATGTGAVATSRGMAPWYVSGAVMTVLLALMLVKAFRGDSLAAPRGAPPAAAAAPDGGGALAGRAPDISNMSPKERFERLFNRVMEAGSRGDTTTVINFLPMALGAYAQVPNPDAGDRFDAALLYLQANQLATARAVTDSIRQGAPQHLLASIMDATLARATGDAAGEAKALAAFKAAWPDEIGRARPEYQIRRALLDEFKREMAP